MRFAAIWSNPPIRIGKQALHALLLQWLPRLADGAPALMVVQKNLGSDSLQRWLTEQGWPTERLTSRNAFRRAAVLPCRRRQPVASEGCPHSTSTSSSSTH